MGRVSQVTWRWVAIHVDQVYLGQPVTLRFSAFNQRVTPEIAGQIVGVSADVMQDPQTGASFYRVEMMALDAELAKLDGQQMLPGMPVEAYLRTEDRTPLSSSVSSLTVSGLAFRVRPQGEAAKREAS